MFKNLYIMKFDRIFPYLIALFLGFAIGYQVALQMEPSADCPAPDGLAEVMDTEASVTVSWNQVQDARYYTVIARDSAALTDVASSIVVEGTSAVIPDLKPQTGYAVDVFTICEKDGKFYISETPTTIGVSTGWIVTDDVVLLQGQPCPFSICTTNVAAPNNCFDWGAGTQYYQVEIVHNASTTVVARTYLEKSVTGAGIRINNYNTATCGGLPVLEAPVECPTFSFCGDFTQPGTSTTVNYKLTASLTQCCLDLPAADYTLRVRSCNIDE